MLSEWSCHLKSGNRMVSHRDFVRRVFSHWPGLKEHSQILSCAPRARCDWSRALRLLCPSRFMNLMPFKPLHLSWPRKRVTRFFLWGEVPAPAELQCQGQSGAVPLQWDLWAVMLEGPWGSCRRGEVPSAGNARIYPPHHALSLAQLSGWDPKENSNFKNTIWFTSWNKSKCKCVISLFLGPKMILVLYSIYFLKNC